MLAGLVSRESLTARASARNRISVTSVLLPLPDTPVTAVIVPERERDVDVLQVVGARLADHERLAVALAALLRDRHALLAAQDTRR